MLKTTIYAALTSCLLASTASAKIKTEEITYEDQGTKLEGFIAYDDAIKGKRPGIIVVHEWWGHNDYARKRATMLAEMGYTAIALDMYGKGKRATHPKDAGKFAGEIASNMALMKSRFAAAEKVLHAHPTVDPKKTAAIGYCFGGAVVLNMARAGEDLQAVASFHGNLKTDAPAKKGAIKGKVFVAHGAADPFVPPEQVEAFKKEMKEAGVELDFTAYEGAQHAFTNPAATENGKKFKLPLAYDDKADKDSWIKLRAFLKRALD